MNDTTIDLITSSSSSIKTLESIKISSTVHSWLNMLNRIVEMSNIVDYPQPDPVKRKYENLFGFMTSEDKFYLDGVKTGITPILNATSGLPKGIDARISTLVTDNAVKTVDYFAIGQSSTAGHGGTVAVNESSIDIQCIDASGDVELLLTASTNPRYYAEKTVSVIVDKNVPAGGIGITYSGQGPFSFVNNAIYPNIQYTDQGLPVRTLMLAGNSIVYRFTFIHGKILVEVVENTQLVENYKTPSERSFDAETHGIQSFAASAALCDALSARISSRTRIDSDIPETLQTLWISSANAVSDLQPSASEAVAMLQTVFEYSSYGLLERARLKCEPVFDGTRRPSQYIDLQNGTHVVDLETDDYSADVRIEYYLNMQESRCRIISLTVIVRDNARTYDE